jgi:hypothetical protein
MCLISFWGQAMRGEDRRSEGMFSYVRLEQRFPADQPLHAIRQLTDAALQELLRDFSKLYACDERPVTRPNDCCARCCSRPFTRFDRNGS